MLAVCALLGACATAPTFDTRGVDLELPPQAVADEAALGKRVLWGGTIVSIENKPADTQIEVLAFPLDRDGEPDTGRSSLGRFLLVRNGYLESLDYAPGRAVTAVGRITGIKRLRIGENDQRIPVIEAAQLHLWPRMSARNEPRFIFGIGIGIGR